jgi:hypothetical protein
MRSRHDGRNPEARKIGTTSDVEVVASERR